MDIVRGPDMAAVAERRGVVFAAHQPGDPDRKARAERPFHTVEHHFYTGLTFATLEDANAQLITWCDARMDHFRRVPGRTPWSQWPSEAAASAADRVVDRFRQKDPPRRGSTKVRQTGRRLYSDDSTGGGLGFGGGGQ